MEGYRVSYGGASHIKGYGGGEHKCEVICSIGAGFFSFHPAVTVRAVFVRGMKVSCWAFATELQQAGTFLTGMRLGV